MHDHDAQRDRMGSGGSGRTEPAMTALQLRFAAAFVHSIPGVTLEVTCVGGGSLTVAHRRLDAQLDPCQFRAAVLEHQRVGLPRLVDVIIGVSVQSGPEHLGGGVYRRCDDQGEQRWFLTELDHDEVVVLLARCPIEGSHETVTAVTRPDPWLGITAVRLDVAHPGAASVLDRVAWWAIGEVVAAELMSAARSEAPGRGDTA